MTTNAALAAQVTDVLTRWNAQLDQLADWLAGSPDGGPNADGRYPLTDASGSTELFQSLPSILEQVAGPAGVAEVAQAAAEAAATLADQHREAAETAQSVVEAAQAAVSQLKTDVTTQRDDVAAKWSDVGVWYNWVNAAQAGILTSESNALTYADDAIFARDETFVARNEANIARDEAAAFAASIDPATLVTQVDLQTEINNLVGGAEGTLDTLNEIAQALGDDPNFATTVTTQLAGKSDNGHGHAIADVAGLSTALDGKQPVGTYAQQTHSHDYLPLSGGTLTGELSVNGDVLLVGKRIRALGNDVLAEAAHLHAGYGLWCRTTSSNFRKHGMDVQSGQLVLIEGGTSCLALRAVNYTCSFRGKPLAMKSDVPASATSSGREGDWASDGNYFYVCYAANSWRRVALSTF